MNIIPATPTPIGMIKGHGSGTTAPAAPGAPGPGSGQATALSDGRTPGETPTNNDFVPFLSIIGQLLDKNS
jgi:hypothetical protein